jgi:phosphoribosylamine---glycine ligase
MQVMVIGGGGREHALAWALARSPRVERVYVAPGNAGTAMEPGCVNVAISATDIDALCMFALAQRIDLTVVGPEAALVAGVVDRFEAQGLRCFGPQATAARLEGSKEFSKAFMTRHGVPTAAYRSFDDVEQALAYLQHAPLPVVIKADGLAAGKGVVIAHDREHACATVRDMLETRVFGLAGARVVIEAFLTGEEASFIVLVGKGGQVLPLASSQDHKARDEGDQGPNTGGMGAYSPAPVITPEIHQRVMRDVIMPTVRGLAQEGMPYTGFLYAGLMVGDDAEVSVLEFNCRLGDPETQPILMRLRSDLSLLLDAALDGELAQATCDWSPQVCLGVVMAAGAYPAAGSQGEPIAGLDQPPRQGVKVFHAGTARDEAERIVTAGGRVLCVCALGDDIAQARDGAYGMIDSIHWSDVHYRRDIGYRALFR